MNILRAHFAHTCALIGIPCIQAAFSEKITCPALLLWGTRDPVQRWCETLPERFEAPLVMKHGRGHVIPQLEQSELDVMRSFLHAQQQNCSL